MFKYILPFLFFLSFFPNPLFSQGLESGNDPFGKPYRPRIGMLRPIIHSGVPNTVGAEVVKKFQEGMRYRFYTNTTYELMDKSQLGKAEELISEGATRQELRRNYREATAGCQTLFRAEINTWQLMDDLDSVFITTKAGKKFDRIVVHKVGTANMTVRLTDVATSKILVYHNIDLTATTKGYTGGAGKTDSVKVVEQLYLKAAQQAGIIFHDFLPASASITKVQEIKKDKAISVLVNDAPLTAYCKKDEGFSAFSISKFYEAGGLVFPHAEYLGNIRKAQDYTWKFPKYNVVSTGKKEMAEKINSGETVIVSKLNFPLQTFLPSPSRTSLVLDNFKNEAFASSRIVRILQDGCMDVLANTPQLIDVVDREIYDDIKIEQSLQQRTKSDASQASVNIGGEYVVACELVKFTKNVEVKSKLPKEEEKKTNTKKEPEKAKVTKTPTIEKGKSKATETVAQESKPKAVEKPKISFGTAVPVAFVYKTEATVNMKVVSVETGEVIFSNAYNVKGAAEIPYTEKDRFNRLQAEEQSFRKAASNLASWMWNDLLYLVTPPIHLLDVLDSGKNGAETVLIGGGKQAGLLDGTPLEVIEKMEENVDGQRLTRDVLVANLRIKKVHPATSVCKVKDGGEALQAKLASGAKLYCKLTR